MSLPPSTEKFLFFLLKLKTNENFIGFDEEIAKRFPNYWDELQILISKELITVMYADDEPYLITILPKALLYDFQVQEEKTDAKKTNLWLPILTTIIGGLAVYLLQKLF